MKDCYILVLNFGSTSTKFAIYNNEEPVVTHTFQHTNEEMAVFENIFAQREFRETKIIEKIKEIGFDLKNLSAVVSRGGLTKPIAGGVYTVDDTMINDLAPKHASSITVVVAYEIAKSLNLPCYIADAVVTDEMEPVARLSGLEGIQRVSIFHALNHKAMARKWAKEHDTKYENCNLVIAHVGGGVSVAAHKNGKAIDVNNGLDGEGPFSPERAGTLPVRSVVDICFSGEYTKTEVCDMFIKKGGMLSYIGTNDGRKAEEMMNDGDEKAKLVLSAMAYQISKDIGAASVVLDGKVDGIILTGGFAHSKFIAKYVEDKTSWIAPVAIMPGENEMLALAQGGLRVLNGEEEAKKFL